MGVKVVAGGSESRLSLNAAFHRRAVSAICADGVLAPGALIEGRVFERRHTDCPSFGPPFTSVMGQIASLEKLEPISQEYQEEACRKVALTTGH
jgi:hypothetical protein